MNNNRLSDNNKHAKFSVHELQSKILRAWQLALLRFAITLDETDRIACLAAAAELDKSGSRELKKPEFGFFHRTSHQLCGAILDPRLRTSVPVLREYIARIGDDRVQRAFAAVVKLDLKKRTPGMRRPGDLWKGLD